MRVVTSFLFVLFASGMLNAATITLHPYFTTEGSPADFAVTVEFQDGPGELSRDIQATVTLTPGIYVGDIVALYVDLASVPQPLPTIAQAIEGDDITGWGTETDNIQGGSVGRPFDIALAIGRTGIGGKHGDIRTTTFRFNTPGLELQHIAAVGVRVGSVGFENGARELSRKMYGSATGSAAAAASASGDRQGSLDAQTPEPSTWALMVCGLGVAVVVRRRKPVE